MAPQVIPLDDLEAGMQTPTSGPGRQPAMAYKYPSAHGAAIRFPIGDNNRPVCYWNGCGNCEVCQGCACFMPNTCNGCEMNWASIVLLLVLLAVILVAWSLSKKA